MRLVPWGQMLADVQARGFTPISWLRFSSRTALTTTCTASNIRAADSWGGGQRWGRRGKRQLSLGAPKPPWCYPRALRQRPSLQERGTKQAGSEDGSLGVFLGESDGGGKNVCASHAFVGAALPKSCGHKPVWERAHQRGFAWTASWVTSTGRCLWA